MTSISVIVPVYNSHSTLRELTQRLIASLSKLGAAFEIIYVNDGSRDQSWETIQDLSQMHSQVRGISLIRNFGQHNAILAGIRMARFAVCVTLDDDLQHPPESVSELIAPLSQGYDVVYGIAGNERHSFFRVLASKATKIALSEVLGAATARKVSAFRAFRTHLREAFKNYNSPYVCIDVLLTWATSRFGMVPTAHHPRKHGTSNYTVVRLVRHAFNMMTGFTVLPLQVASWLGFSFVLVGLCLLGFVLIRWLIFGSIVPGFAFLATEIAIFSGIQLFCLGIFGEYLARMHQRSMDKPAYVIDTTTLGLLDARQA